MKKKKIKKIKKAIDDRKKGNYVEVNIVEDKIEKPKLLKTDDKNESSLPQEVKMRKSHLKT